MFTSFFTDFLKYIWRITLSGRNARLILAHVIPISAPTTVSIEITLLAPDEISKII